MKITRYGLASESQDNTGAEQSLMIEMDAIRRGGNWTDGGKVYGNGLSFHYGQMRKIVWPHLDDEDSGQRWHKLCRDEISKNKITVLLGAGSTGKTHEAAWFYLCDYFCFPQITCVLVSSTDIRGLKKRVWGEMVSLWEMAVTKFPFLSGYLLDSALAITTDNIDDFEEGECKSRDMRKGIFGIPCVQGGKFVGLSKFIGIKQKRMRLVADEASAMDVSFLSAFSNLNKNEDFRAVILGNPNDPLDPLGRAAEPKEGWTDEYLEPTKTKVWDTRFMGGRCVNLIGLDSPNFDFPASEPTRFKYLISREKIEDTLSFFPKDSVEYYSQCVGTMKVGTMARRVITRSMCEKNKALEKPLWRGDGTTKIAGLDSAWGGDRACLMHCEYGLDSEGSKIILSFSPPTIIPIKVAPPEEIDRQISEFCKEYCGRHDIVAANFFHDSTGRGTLGTALAREWSDQCNPVEFGGSPTARPVSLDLFIYDEEKKMRRLKRCDEHYSKFVTELWYSLRYAIESQQVRNFPADAMEEASLRQWDKIKNGKIEVESKTDMKERVGRSPDICDAAAICLEGARRRGFQISKLGNSEPDKEANNWLADLSKKRFEWNKSKQLAHSK